jgi:hypothetical protein
MAEIPSSKKYGRSSSPAPGPSSSQRAANSSGNLTTSSISGTSSTSGNGCAWLIGIAVVIALGWMIFGWRDHSPSLAYTPYPLEQRVRVSPTTYVNARNGPGIEYPISTEVAPGTLLIAMGERQSPNGSIWLAIKSENDTVSYINQRLLVLEQ